MAITIRVGPEANKKIVTLEMDIRKSLNGDLMIFDHGDIDIVLSPKDNKVLAFPKETMTDLVYGAQNRLFAHLRKKGLVIPESIQSGAFYGVIEAEMQKSFKQDLDTAKMTLINISKFIDEERPYFEFEKAFDAEEERRLAEPGPEDSTEYDPERYHSTDKGSIRPGIRPFGIANIYRLEESMEE